MKKLYFLLILVLVLFILLVNFFPSLQREVKSSAFSSTSGTAKFFSGIGRSFKNKVRFIFVIRDLKKQNQRLSDKIIEMEVDKSHIIELETENLLLKKEISFLDQNEKGALIPARIIDREPTTFLDSFIVDKGSDDNVKEGSSVTFNGVLVGQVKEVYKNASKIVLITSKDSIVQVMLQESRAKGILKGGINGLFMENIISDTDYKNGEYVTTSGLGGKMKPGILIGRAGKTESSSSGIFKSVSVETIVDLSTLELVFIEKQ